MDKDSHFGMPPACRKVVAILLSNGSTNSWIFARLSRYYWGSNLPRHVPEPYNAGTILGSVLNRMVANGWLVKRIRKVADGSHHRAHWSLTAWGLTTFMLEVAYREALLNKTLKLIEENNESQIPQTQD